MKEQQIKKETKEQRMDKRIEKVQIEKAPGRIRAPEPRSPELQISWLEAAKDDHNWPGQQTTSWDLHIEQISYKSIPDSGCSYWLEKDA